MNNGKARLLLTIAEALSGVLGVIALIGNFALDAKEAKEIGCDVNETKN